jgi:hypothetical protein
MICRQVAYAATGIRTHQEPVRQAFPPIFRRFDRQPTAQDRWESHLDCGTTVAGPLGNDMPRLLDVRRHEYSRGRKRLSNSLRLTSGPPPKRTGASVIALCALYPANSPRLETTWSKRAARVEVRHAVAASRGRLDHGGEDPRDELAFHAQLADVQRVLGQTSGVGAERLQPRPRPRPSGSIRDRVRSLR